MDITVIEIHVTNNVSGLYVIASIGNAVISESRIRLFLPPKGSKVSLKIRFEGHLQNIAVHYRTRGNESGF
jgi:hypothetical protein